MPTIALVTTSKGRVGRGPLILAGTQAAVTLVSMVAFAVLARLLGPAPFGSFAALLLIFSIISLATDLAPQAYLLVHGESVGAELAASRMAMISGSSSSVLTLIVGASYCLLVDEPDWLAIVGLLAIGQVAQTAMQIPRAKLLLAGQYTLLAVADVVGTTVASMLVTIWAALNGPSVVILCAQLSSSLALRWLICQLAVRDELVATEPGSLAPSATRFALKALPLNIGSYLSRSLDSGVMPILLGTVAGGVYARSFQVVITPVSQLQLAIGPWALRRLGIVAREGRSSHDPSYFRYWLAINGLAGALGVLAAVAAPVLEAVLFGPGWPHATLMLTCMSTTLPALTLNTMLAWLTQVFGRASKSYGHLLAVLLSPTAAIAGAAVGGLPTALLALSVVGGCLQGLVLCRLHRDVLPTGRIPAALIPVLAWLPCQAVFMIHFFRI